MDIITSRGYPLLQPAVQTAGKVCNCIHSVLPPVKLPLSSQPHGRLNMLNPIKRPFSALYVSASQSLFAACMKKGGLNGHAIPFKPPCLQDFHDRRNSR